VDDDSVHSCPVPGARRSGTVTVHADRVRVTLLAGIVLLAATWTGAAPARALTPAVVKPTQELAALLSAHEAFSKPAQDSAPLGLVQARRPITEERTVLPVLGHRTGGDGLRWLHVRLPGRPNGRAGWIRQRATVSSRTSWHIVVDTSSRRVTVYQHSRRARVFKAIVGKASTPTPHGEFFVEEAIQLRAADVGAPFALALSARSNVLQEFAGGPGQIALHGLRNVGGTLGTAVSHGCVRLDTGAMRWLVVRIGPGVPVTITS
jgi:lipoprotein-anchoring transpeptidase ErfK/SrfK